MLTMNEEQKLKFCYALWFCQPDVVEASLNHKQRASSYQVANNRYQSH
ncbi:hypothetical protein SORBI_3004G144000 [Sorghum bicolor]|uniref:Uncharacterized protein n=1 Tax=Sorghum bicolor TaxID=4558 RepID=A0A194YQU2_SORBI|nr:hypothetical protein SORBI_3004G144000 [Sorghum bicolor]